ncbi:MAG: hypothetical protein IT385_22415 [Deltaproteobacteria bacterium]|nr:hypothetical protein [Deltaproteobacteria bacterium]
MSVFGACVSMGWSGAGCDEPSEGADAATASDTGHDTTTSDDVATSDASTGGDGATTTLPPDAQPDAITGGGPTLSSLIAHVAGTRGFDLDLAIVGADGDGDAALARVRLLDGGGAPVLAFRSGLADTPDSNETLVPFASPVTGQTSFITRVRLRGLYGEHPTIARVEVALRDAAGNLSADVAADVIAQAVRQIGDGCDPEAVEDRCPPGAGCRGTPAQCQEGLPPEATRVAYLKGEGGTRILVQGTEPEDDLQAVRVEFLDDQGQPRLVDLDNDTVAESTEFDVDGTGKAIDGAFLVRVDPAPGFEDVVPQIAVTPRDAAGHVGARKTTRLANVPVRAVGQGCDIHGFDVCSATSVCAPGLPGATNTCKAKSQLAPAECAAAPVLDPSAAPAAITGLVDGPSLWDAPPSCSSGDPKGRPEAVVVLRLVNAAKKVTLTTALPGTNFDTVLYVLPGCGASGAEPLGCADDAPEGSAAASLVLDLVPAGDYLIVVDSWGPDGGSFALEVAVE